MAMTREPVGEINVSIRLVKYDDGAFVLDVPGDFFEWCKEQGCTVLISVRSLEAKDGDEPCDWCGQLS